MATKTTATETEVGWISINAMANLLGLDRSRIEQLRKKYDHKHERGKHGSIRLYAPGWVQMYVESKKGSASLERVRELQARKLEIEIAEKEGLLISMEYLGEQVESMVGAIREATDRFCPVCLRIINDALDRWRDEAPDDVDARHAVNREV